MLSRVADSIYWLGRYVERAENVARFIDVNFNLMLDLPGGIGDQWQPLVDITGDTKKFAERYGDSSQRNWRASSPSRSTFASSPMLSALRSPSPKNAA